MTFVASEFAVVDFLCALDAVSMKSEFRDENNHEPVIPSALIVYSLRFWIAGQRTFIEIAVYNLYIALKYSRRTKLTIFFFKKWPVQ